jgi:membrane protein involved in colicin uptake
VEARAVRKNHKAELSLHPDRIRSQEAQGRKVPNRRQVKVRAVRKNHKAELSWHPVRIKSQELDRMALNKQLKRARKAHKLQVTLWWQRVREKKQVQNLEGQRTHKNSKVQAETRVIKVKGQAEKNLHRWQAKAAIWDKASLLTEPGILCRK